MSLIGSIIDDWELFNDMLVSRVDIGVGNGVKLDNGELITGDEALVLILKLFEVEMDLILECLRLETDLDLTAVGDVKSVDGKVKSEASEEFPIVLELVLELQLELVLTFEPELQLKLEFELELALKFVIDIVFFFLGFGAWALYKRSFWKLLDVFSKNSLLSKMGEFDMEFESEESLEENVDKSDNEEFEELME